MIFWSWTCKEPYSKTSRGIKKQDLEYDSKQNAVTQSLTDNNEDKDLMSITNDIFSRHKEISNNKRENLDEKISSRQLVPQCGTNPFQQTNYVDDIITRDMFLKPVNTTSEVVEQTTPIIK